MRYGVFDRRGTAGWGRIDGDLVQWIDGPPWTDHQELEAVPLGSVTARPWTPGKIVGIGSNYRDHAAEMGKPVPAVPKLFLKAPSAVLQHGGTIEIPPGTTRVDHEAELGVVIGRRCRRVREEDALAFVFGYTCVNDVTARDWQREDGVFARGKGVDTFCPMGPWIETGLDPSALSVGCRVNGTVRQDGNTRDMVFGVATLLVFVSEVMTLEPGDVIATGTPAGVGPLVAGDTVEVEVGGIGVLRNLVAARS